MTVDAVGGVWTYALDLADGLAAEGVQTVLAVLGPTPSAEQQAAAASVTGLALHTMNWPLDWLADCSREVADAGAAVAALARTEAVDLVQLNSPALAAGAAFDMPVVAACHSCLATWWDAVHGTATPMPGDFAWRCALLADGYARADALVAPSLAFARATRAAYRLPALPDVVRNGRSPSSISGVADETDYVFSAGRFWDAGKNLGLLDAVAEHLPIRVVAAGPLAGPNGATTTVQHVHAVDTLQPEQIARWLAPAPIFVSLARYEPFGLAVLEAAQAGCPLVLSDIPTFRELWREAAAFVPLDSSPRSVADTIEALSLDQKRRSQLGAAARDRSRRYTVSAMTRGMLEVYGKVLAQHRAPHSVEEMSA